MSADSTAHRSPFGITAFGRRLGLREITLWTVAILYVLSVCTPAVSYITLPGAGNDSIELSVWWGWDLMLLGWLAVVAGIFAWGANLLLACAFVCLLIRHAGVAIGFSVAALFCSADMLLFNTAAVPADESGFSTLQVHRMLFGGWCWYAAMAVMLVGSVLVRWGTRRPSAALPALEDGEGTVGD